MFKATLFITKEIRIHGYADTANGSVNDLCRHFSIDDDNQIQHLDLHIEYTGNGFDNRTIYPRIETTIAKWGLEYEKYQVF